jgi:hypothetical protein
MSDATESAGRRRHAVWRLAAGSATRWRWSVLGVAVIALLVRVLLIAHSHGGSDLRNYTYFARLALQGHDPYLPPAHGAFGATFADSPPLEYVVLSLLLRVHNSPTTLRVLFAIADVAVVLLVGFRWPAPRSWRAAFVVFYALNPLVLISWTVYAEDKTLLFLAVAVALLGVEQGRALTSWLAATALTAFKFLGAFLVPVLLVDTLRERRARGLWFLAGFVILVAVTSLAWFPDGLRAFTHRNGRLGAYVPIHSSPMLLVSRIGLYASFEPTLLAAIALIAIVVLVILRRLEVAEALALSLLAGYIFLPDDSFGRLLLVTIPFLLLVRPTSRQWAAVWVVTTVAAIAAAIETQGVPHALAPISGALRAAFSHESTVRSVLWLNAPVVTVLWTYWAQRQRAGSRGIR